MLEVRFRRDSRDRLSSVFSSGHAEQGEPGEDVVCSAVYGILELDETVSSGAPVILKPDRLLIAIAGTETAALFL